MNGTTTQSLLGRQASELASLRDLSARLGSDPLLVQANNGNTSIKLDGVLWIKASGKWLAHAMQEELLVPVELARARAARGNFTEIALRDSSKHAMRPSIETAMHAILSQRVVIHVHSIDTIAWAIRLDGRDHLQERLHGLHWQWIPYALSGIPLAQEIEKAVARAPETNIFVLGNHGLVVCGEDCDTAEQLLREVEQRLAIIPRPAPGPDNSVLATIAGFSRWQYPDCDLLHALGTDAATLKILRGGLLYPCQAIFLGREMPLLPSTFPASKFREQLEGKDSGPPFVAVERGGVMLNEEMTSAQRATLLGLVQITQRTAESAQLRYLNTLEVEQILSWGAHGYKDGAEVGKRVNSPARIENTQRKPSCNQKPCFS